MVYLGQFASRKSNIPWNVLFIHLEENYAEMNCASAVFFFFEN
jgi:hypothetical protein